MTQIFHQTVSAQVEHLLPTVLIDYLWNLVHTEQTSEDHAFILKKQVLSGKDLQEIQHLAGRNCIRSHKVFGFEPVNTTIVIHRQNGILQMQSAGLPEAFSTESATYPA